MKEFSMQNDFRHYALIAVLAAAVSLATIFLLQGAIVRNYLANHPEEVQRIVKDYLSGDPSVLREIVTAAFGGAGASNEQADDKSAVIKSNAQALFSSPHQVTLGNPAGDVTLVEFFDYNCGYCRRALPDMLTLIKDDPKLKVVLKEFPILSPESVEAARVAIAVRMQDPTGQKYLDFHRKLLGDRGQASREKAIAAAGETGVDLKRLESDMASDEVSQTIAENRTLAQALGIDGTPCYVIGDTLVLGAVGLDALKEKIQTARDQAAK
jgi:protein-disulfide isomerase